MRRRIVALLLPVLVLMMIGGVAVAGVLVSERKTQAVYADRIGDATRFAAMINDAVGSESTTRLAAEFRAYAELYDSPVWVVGLDGGLLHDPGTPLPTDPEVRQAIGQTLAGSRVAETSIVWPWSAGPIYVMEPVGRDSQVTAAVVIEAPTERLRTETLRDWGLGSAILLLPLLGLLIAMWPITRWILRPVTELGEVAGRIAAGDLTARADADHGPPELRELAGGFNSMVTTVQNTLQRQRDFVADAAHQLRNPLSSLRLSLDGLKPATDEQSEEAYTDALAESERMSSMFESMLAATAAGDESVDGGRRSVSTVIDAGHERWADVLADARMRLQVGPVPRDLLIREPTGGLAGLIDELVANAARLSGGSLLRIDVEAATVAPPSGHQPDQGTPVIITVADDGTGLSDADLASATGRFWRADRHQNVAGTGLGLAIIAEAVADAGGQLQLHASSELGGLEVRIELPGQLSA